jgi:hypothetical protein
MNKDWQTVTENKQIQQSVTFFFLEGPTTGLLPCTSLPFDSGVGGTPPRAFNCLRALVLSISFLRHIELGSSLELVRSPLPIPSHLHSHLDTSIHILLTSLVIYPELKYIPVLIVSLLRFERLSLH